MARVRAHELRAHGDVPTTVARRDGGRAAGGGSIRRVHNEVTACQSRSSSLLRILYFTPKLKIEPAQRASMLLTLELHGGGDPLLAASKGNLPRISLDDPDERVRADAWDEDAFGEGLLEHKLLVSDVGRGQWWIAVYNIDGLEASRAPATLTVRFVRQHRTGRKMADDRGGRPPRGRKVQRRS